jgi:multidrug resistance efflux pump
MGAAILVVVGLAAIFVTLRAWHFPPFQADEESTQNAYIRGRTTSVAPQVSGYVTEVLVHDYQEVKRGQLLARIDERVYRARVEAAQANLDNALAAVANSHQSQASRMAALSSQRAGQLSANAQLRRAQAEFARVEALVSDGSVSERERDQSKATLAQAEATLLQSQAGGEMAQQEVRIVEVGRNGLQAQVAAARAQLKLAMIDLEHTEIRAPEDGQVGEVSVRLGQYVSNGVQLLALVPPERWIIANYKETEIADIRPGMPARFSADALGKLSFTGKVVDLSPAAGSEFAALKPDNATGNFVKVPQRIGVRVLIDPSQPEAKRLRPGMSVNLTIDTERS